MITRYKLNISYTSLYEKIYIFLTSVSLYEKKIFSFFLDYVFFILFYFYQQIAKFRYIPSLKTQPNTTSQ